MKRLLVFLIKLIVLFIPFKYFRKSLRKRLILMVYGSEYNKRIFRVETKLLKQFLKKERKNKGFSIIPNVENPKVSIIIPVYNQWKYTKQCINSIVRHTDKNVFYEIILVDDCSFDQTVDVCKYYPNIKYIRNKINLGFVASVNEAAKLVEGEYIILLNNDTVVYPNWLVSMKNVFDNNPDVGIVGSKLLFSDGMLQGAGGYITKEGRFGNFGRRDYSQKNKYNYLREVDYVSGCSLMIKTSLWKKLEGFDSVYAPAYLEDTDLAMRCRKEGFKVMYQPLSKVFHFDGKSHSDKKYIQMERNRKIFINKWSDVMRSYHSSQSDFSFYDRGINRKNKTILYIDESCPNIYSAGSELSWNYCKLLKGMGYNIKYLPFTKLNISALESFSQEGIEVLGDYDILEIKPKKFKKYFAENSDAFDYIYLARPFSKLYLDIIKSIQPKSQFFYHPADLHFLRIQRELALNLKKIDKHALKNLEKIKQDELFLLKNAKKVLHVSNFEKEYVKKEFGINNGEIIPCLFFSKIEKFRILPNGLNNILFVGGRHKPNIDAMKWFIKNIFPAIFFKNPSTKLHIVGDVCEEINVSLNENIILHGRISDEALLNIYNNIAINIIPLRYGAGVKGKLLESLYFGVPIVATSIGLEGIKEIKTIYKACDDEKSFIQECNKILGNPRRYQERIFKGQKLINKYFTNEYAELILKKVFQK